MSEDRDMTFEEEFRRLGDNLKENIEAFWNKPENEEFRQEIKSGLVHLGDTVNNLVQDFNESPEGKRLHAEVEDFEERLKSGQVEAKIREDVLKILGTMNLELEKVRKGWEKPADMDESETEE
jgi:HD-GYP domain-containing protein (c-di-GMP phosphodiesterase class II)